MMLNITCDLYDELTREEFDQISVLIELLVSYIYI